MIHNFKRTLGKSGIEVSALGMGCWAIGGPFTGFGGLSMGWGDVNDEHSLEALQTALDHGVNFFDTADVYGTGHSERLLSKAFKGIRDQVVIATKFGFVFDEVKKEAYELNGHGLLTQALINAFFTKNDGVEIGALMDTVTKHVRAEADRYGFDQTPTVFNLIEGGLKFPPIQPGPMFIAMAFLYP